MKRRFDGSYSPGSPASSHARISPDGPSTIVERRSAAVGAMMPIRRIFRERRRLYSEPVFVLCVGIIASPARYIEFGESTVMHRIGIGSISS